jgi:hypothetical protein
MTDNKYITNYGIATKISDTAEGITYEYLDGTYFVPKDIEHFSFKSEIPNIQRTRMLTPQEFNELLKESKNGNKRK